MHALKRSQLFRCIRRNTVASCRVVVSSSNQLFSTSAPSRTDGVFRKLTEMRVPTPWIVALREKQRQEKEHGNVGSGAGEASTGAGEGQDHKLTPKKMSDSYVSVVLPLGQDKWLSDTYLNSEGNIRCDT